MQVSRIKCLSTFAFTLWSLLLSLSLSAQCPSPSFQIPQNVCAGQPINLSNTSSGGASYQWNFCSGRLRGTPLARDLANVPVSGTGTLNIRTNRSVFDGTNYYSFVIGSDNRMYRLIHQQDPTNVVRVETLGNVGNVLRNAAGLEFVNEGGNWYAFVSNANDTKLIRYNFGANLGADAANIAVDSASLAPNTLTNAGAINIVKEGNNYFGFVLTNSGLQFLVVQFGPSITNRAPSTYVMIGPGAGCPDFSLIKDCGSWYLFTVTVPGLFNDRIFSRANLGNNLSNLAPSWVPFFTQRNNETPTGMRVVREGGQLNLLTFFASGLVRINNFRSQPMSPPLVRELGPYNNVMNIRNPTVLPVNGSDLIVLGGSLTNNNTRFNRLFFTDSCFASAPGSSLFNPAAFSYRKAGKYYISLDVTSADGQIKSVVDSITVGPAFTPRFNTTRACGSLQVTFAENSTLCTQSTIVAYDWDFGDAIGRSSQPSPTYTYAVPGFYNVTLKATNALGMTEQVTQRVIVENGAMVADFSTPANNCSGSPIQFTDLSTSGIDTIRSWSWTFGDGGTSSARNPIYAYQTGGTFNVSLTITGISGCTKVIQKQITLRPGIAISFATSQSCKLAPVTFNNTSVPAPGVNVLSYSWNFGDGSPVVTGFSPTHTYQRADTFLVTVTAVGDNGCTSVRSVGIRIFDQPNVKFGFPAFNFFGDLTPFSDSTIADRQSVTAYEWDFGDVASGANNTSSLRNPTHRFTQPGSYLVRLIATSNLGCKDTLVRQIDVKASCPSISYDIAAVTSPINSVVPQILNTGPANFFEQDQCAGDFASVPLAVSQDVINAVITNTTRIAVAKDDGKWYGIGVNAAELNQNNSQVVHLYEFDTTLSNAPVITNQGILGGQLNKPADMALMRTPGGWIAWFLNFNGTLVRVDLGQRLNPLLPAQSRLINLPAPIRNPIKMRLVQDKDSVFIFALSSDGTNNNFTRIAFGPDLLAPQVTVLNNPTVLQSAAGLRAVAIARDCNKWVAILAGPAQIFRLNYGFSLNSTPTVENITPQLSLPSIPAAAISNAAEILIRRDAGKIYTFLLNGNGNLLRWEWSGGLTGNVANVLSLGNLTILGNTRWMTLVNDKSQWFGFSSNFNASIAYRIKWPDNCSAQVPFFQDTVARQVPMSYSRPGVYRSTITLSDTNGFISSAVDSVRITATGLTDSLGCLTGFFQVTNPNKETCRNNLVTTTFLQSGTQRLDIDACAGELALPASGVTASVLTTITAGGARGFDMLFDGTNWVALSGMQSNINRMVLGPNLDQVISNDQVGTALLNQNVAGIKLFSFEGNYYAFGVSNFTGTSAPPSELFLLDFGRNLNNLGVQPTYRRISGGGNLVLGRFVEVIVDRGEIYVIVTCSANNKMIIYEFGKSPLNFPTQRVVDIPVLSGTTGLSMIKECGTWHGLVVQQTPAQAMLFSFGKGMKFDPVFRPFITAPTSGTAPYSPLYCELVHDAGVYYAFTLATRPTGGPVMLRYNLGSTMTNPRIGQLTDMGNFTLLGSGLASLNLFKARNSVWTAFATAEIGGTQVMRFQFGQPCPVQQPFFSTLPNPDLRYDGSGGFKIEIAATDSATGILSRYVDTLTIRNPVNADFNVAGQLCKGGVVIFSDQSTRNVPTAQLDYRWNFGTTADPNVVQSNSQNPTFTYDAPGVYTVRLRVSESSGCVDERVRQIRIKAKPAPFFTTPLSTCSYDSVSIVDQSNIVGDTIASRLWTVYDASNNVVATSTAPIGRFALAQQGAYTVTLRLLSISGCDSTSAPVPLAVNRQGSGFRLDVDTGGNCLGNVTRVRIIRNSGDPQFISQRWTISTGDIFTARGFLTDTFFVFPSSGRYTVSVTTENLQGCNTTITRSIPIYVRPSAVIDFSQPCNGSPITFTTPTISGDGSIVRRRWYFGDGTSDTTNNTVSPLHTYPGIGQYTVRLRLTSSTGCENEVSQVINVGASPLAGFNYTPACVGDFTRFNNLSSANGLPGGITNYLWDFGDGGTSPQSDPSHQYLSGGRFTVTLTVVAGNCANTLQQQVDIPELPAVTIGNLEGCIGQPYIFIDRTPYTGTPARPRNRVWQINGRSFTDSIVTYLPDAGVPNLNATLEITSQAGCQSSRTINLIVPENAIANFRPLDSVFTEGQPLTVRFQNRSANAQAFKWNFGNGDTSTVFGPTYTYQSPGVYRVCLTAYRNSQCSTEVCRFVNAIPNRKPDISVINIVPTLVADQLTLSAEIKNSGNVEVKQLDLKANLDQLVTVQEQWQGSILPGATVTISLRTITVPSQSRRLGVACIEAQPAGELDAKTDDNVFCAALSDAFRVYGVSPNPNAGQPLNIRYTLPREGAVNLVIMDALGRIVKTLDNSRQSSGVYDLTYPVDDVPLGVYYIRCRFETEQQTVKFVRQ